MNAQTLMDQRNALYRLVQGTIGNLDGMDPFGDSLPVPYEQIRELRQEISAEVERILPASDAMVEEVDG
jgi:hypothetical protein